MLILQKDAGVLRTGGRGCQLRRPTVSCKLPLEELRPKPAVPVKPDAAAKPWKNFGEMRQVYERLREQVGETCYREELERAGVQNRVHFQSARRALACCGRRARIVAQREVA